MGKDKKRIDNSNSSGKSSGAGTDSADSSAPIPGNSGDALCPTGDCKIIAGKFVETSIWCGDAANLKAWEKMNIADNANVTFSISRERDDGDQYSANGQLNPNECTTPWQPKMPTDHQKDDQYIINEVAADGATAVGENKFQFLIPDKKETKIIPFSTPQYTCIPYPGGVGPYAFTGKYDIEVAQKEIRVTVKIYFQCYEGTFYHDCVVSAMDCSVNPFIGDPHCCIVEANGRTVYENSNTPQLTTFEALGGNTSNQVDTLLTEAEAIYNRNFTLKRVTCVHGNGCSCLYDVVFKFIKVDSAAAAHHTVKVYAASMRANAKNWAIENYYSATDASGAAIIGAAIGNAQTVWAHEIGHLLGWPDEYIGGAINPRWVSGGALLARAPTPPPLNWVSNSANLMGNMTAFPLIRQNYGWDFRDWLKEALGGRDVELL